MVRTLQAELDRHIARGEIDDAAGDEERGDAARPLLGAHKRGLGDTLDAADAGTDHYAGRSLIFVARRLPAGLFERLTRSTHRKDDELVDPALFLRLHPLVGIVGAAGAVAARNRAGDFRREILDVEFLDSFRATLTGEQALPCRLDAATEWRHHPEPRDDNPPHTGSLLFTTRAGEPGADQPRI